jgi:hypothetical protein
MGVYIKGVTQMQMMRVLIHSTKFMPDDSEIIEVKSPHGRLIDAEVIKDSFMEKVQGERLVFDDERYFPTVIEAEVE